jgi:glycosyltransferase involved in cell wall biosynthesis
MDRDGPRLLLVLPQLPQDPVSGAARSMTSICELLAESGWQVRSLSTTMSESRRVVDPGVVLEALGIDVDRHSKRGPEFHYSHRGVHFRALVSAGSLGLEHWERVDGRRFNLAFAEELGAFKPDIMFTYGMYAGDLRRQQSAIRAGAAVVFGLRNEAYVGFGTWGHVSGVLTPSQHLADVYRADCGLECTALLAPLDPTEIVAAEREPIFITMVNPSSRKGVDFFARLAERMSVSRPDLPFLVIESEGSAGTLAAAGHRAGFDLRRHENIMISAAVPQPKDIFGPTRVLVVPSLHEAGARVVAEALLNGVPPVVSDRGGLPEMCCGAGRILPLSNDGAVDAWADTLVALMDDDDLYRVESEKALEASKAFDRNVLRPKYDAFFRASCDDSQRQLASACCKRGPSPLGRIRRRNGEAQY